MNNLDYNIKKGDITGSDDIIQKPLEGKNENETVLKDMPEKSKGMIEMKKEASNIIKNNSDMNSDQNHVTVIDVEKNLNDTRLGDDSNALENQTITFQEAVKSLQVSRNINTIDLNEITTFDYIIKPGGFNPWPILKFSDSITREHSSRPEESGHDIASREMCETNMAVWTQSGSEDGSDVYDKSWMKVGADAVRMISEIVLSPLYALLHNQSFFSYSLTSEMNVNNNGTISDLFDNGMRSLVYTPTKRNPHVVPAAMMMSAPARQRIMSQIANNTDENRKMKLGVNNSLTIAGSRHIIQYSHEVLKPEQVLIAEVMYELAQTDTVTTILNKIIPSIVEKNGSGYYLKPTIDNGPSQTMDPYITRDGIQMSMLLMCGSKLMRARGNTLLQTIGTSTPFEVSETNIQNLKTALAQNQFGSLLNESIRGVSINDVMILLHASVAPYLYDIEHIDDMTTSAASLPAFVELIAILFEYILFPVIAHKRDHILIYRLMTIIHSNFMFGKNYINVNQYSNDEVNPTNVDMDTFYSEGGYPNILKTTNLNSLSPQIVKLRAILLYQGENVDVERQWDVDNKVFKTAIPFVKPNASGKVLDERLNLLRAFLQDCQDDKSGEIWKGRTKEEVNTAIEEVFNACRKTTRIIHYALGHMIRTFASLPTSPMGVPNMFDRNGTTARPIILSRRVKEGRVIDTPGYRVKIRIPITTSISIFVGASSNLFDSDNRLNENVGYANEEIVKRNVEMTAKMFEDGTKACIALMAANVATEYITNSLEAICPIDDDGNRNFVTESMKNLSRGNPQWIVPSENSDDVFTNPKYVSQLNQVRPDPSRFYRRVVEKINEQYPTIMADLITTTNDFLTGQKSHGPMFYFISTFDSEMRSPNIYFTEDQYTKLFAMMIQRQIDPSSRENGFTRGIVLCQTLEKKVDRFGVLDNTFNYADFIDTKMYSKPDEDPLTYERIWLVESLDEDITGIPEDVDGFGIITPGGINDLIINHSFDQSSIFSLYICPKDNFSPHNPRLWIPYDTSRRIILEGSSASKLMTTPEAPKVIKQLISRTASQDKYPGTFVYTDRHVIINVDPIKSLLNTMVPRHDSLDDDTSFYFESPDVTELPPLYNDVWNLRMGMGMIGDTISTITKFYNGSKSIERIAATRPNTIDKALNGQNVWTYDHYSDTYSVSPFWALFDNGDAVDGKITATASLLGGERQVVHLVTQINEKMIINIDKYRLVYKRNTH